MTLIEIEIINIKIAEEKYGCVNSYMRLKMILPMF